MANPFFTFKQFTIRHDRCAMKVGTDGVLLGAWTSVDHSHRLLDIGTGTGLIALMLAQRCPQAFITAIDIDAEAVEQARENALSSPWKDRVEVLLQDICTFPANQQFDTIVSNPPYFIDSLKCPDDQRNTARHTDTLDAERLLASVARLLTDDGRFSIILPAEQTDYSFRPLIPKDYIRPDKQQSLPVRAFPPNGYSWNSKRKKKRSTPMNSSSNWNATSIAKGI